MSPPVTRFGSAKGRLARTLHELSDFKRALDEHAIVAITDPQGRITYVNDKFCVISKYSREELIGQDHRIINSGHHPKAFMKRLWDTILSGQVWKGEIRNRAKDGTLYWMDTTIVPFLDERGKPRQFVAIRADITQRKLSEEGLRQSQNLESLGVLAGGIAHDFNNLLTVILGNADLGLVCLPKESPARPYFEQIEKASLRASDMVRQLLAYAGKGHVEVSELDLNQLVKEMTELLSVSISKKVEVRYELSPRLPRVTADSSQLQQVIMNLVINASEAIGKDRSGLITVRTGMQEVDEAYLTSVGPTLAIPPGLYTILEVCDTGCGMTPEIQARIFDPFFTTKFTGRGLGLSAMVGILRAHHGSIKVYSEPGRGASFKLFLPTKPKHPAEHHEKANFDTWRAEGTLLVVDDDRSARSVARGMGESLGRRPEPH